MNKTMGKDVFCRSVAVFTVMFALCSNAMAQGSGWSQEVHCRGWNNPSSFTLQGSGLYNGTFYQGRTGDKTYSNGTQPNAATGQTDVNWGDVIANTAMASTTLQTGGDCATFPSNKPQNNAFAIYSVTDQVSGSPVNSDPNTGNNLPFVPTQFNTNDPLLDVQTNLTKSIRLGTACGRPSSSGGYHNASALYYNLNVTPQNAMLYLYYACVFESPGHGLGGDPGFMIRVMTERNGQWVQASPTGTYPSSGQCDTLAYFVTGTPASNGGTVVNGQNGWHTGSWLSHSVYYKDWAKVVLNLTSMMYSTVRIELMVNSCDQMQHFAYAYVCGECRPVEITTSGCPAGMSTDVTTLAAPRGMINYEWYRSEYGGYSPLNNTTTFTLPNSDPNSTAYYTFRHLTPNEDGGSDTAYRYHAKAEDFSVEYMPNTAHATGIEAPEDSMCNRQVFRCTVTSAINPAKPYESNIYAIVQNIKPTMDVDTLSLCGGDVRLRNTSYVPGSESMVVYDSTVWSFYDNPLCTGDPDTVVYGETVEMNFPGSAARGVKVRSNINEWDADIPNNSRPEHNACYSEAVYPLRLLPNPVAGFRLSDTILCASDPVATLYDTTSNSTYRKWIFRAATNDSTHALTDTVVGDGADQNRTYQHTFPIHSDGVEPIGLIVRNGNYYLNPTNQSEVIWCEDTVYHSLNIFTNPQLTGHGDSIVCQGDRTRVWVTSDIENCTYQWSTRYGTLSGGNLQDADTLKVQPYADTATYYVLVTSPAPQNCQAWDSARVFLVSPRLSMLPSDGRICPGDPVTLTGSNAHHFTWTASPADTSLNGQDSNASIVVYPQVNTTYTLVGHGSNDCNASPLTTAVTVYPYPVPVVELDPGAVDSEDPTLILRDVSPYSVMSAWTFAGGEIVPGREVTHTFEEVAGADSVYVTLTNANELNCETVYPFSIPVNLYTAWFPNVFTPGSEDANAKFKLYTINAYEIFHIYIYNRFGQLVYDSSDPAFEWDGTMADGSFCPQGTYTYICRYRKPGANTLASMFGSITLVR